MAKKKGLERQTSSATEDSTCSADTDGQDFSSFLGPAGELAVGDYVEVYGLQGAKELNGRRGRIVAFVGETQRVGVKLEGDEESKAVKPANLRKFGSPGPTSPVQSATPGMPLMPGMPGGQAFSTRAIMEMMLADVVERLKQSEEGSEERSALQKELASLIGKIKQQEEAAEAAFRAKARAETKSAAEAKAALAPASPPRPLGGLSPASPITLQPPPLPREQHHPLPQQMTLQQHLASLRADVRIAQPPRPQPPPMLPEWPPAQPYVPTGPPIYSDEHEYPDLVRSRQALRVAAGAFVCGIIASQIDLFSANWFVWSFLGVHLVGVIFLTDYANESGLLALCATFGLHAGVSLSEFALFLLGRDGADSVGPWSAVVFFAAVLYLHSFWKESSTLPPDYITSISLFFPMFPAFNAAIAMSCLELFLEWRYFPEYKIWNSAIALGILCMAAGQTLIFTACRTGGRNFWASCRNMPEDEEKPEDFMGLEIPDRRIVQEGAYRWERHPAYLGATLWGVGAQITLCNPIMLVITSFVLWASLLYVALEEEQELYEEFKGSYANYSALTCCWIPMFNSFLENAAFQREMSDNAEEPEEEDPDEEPEEEDEEGAEDEVQSEDDMLPTWEGVPKGGALWNRQFRDPWMLG